MTQRMATVFIGSSSEARNIANAIQDNLSIANEVVVWDQDIFHLGEGQFDSLIAATQEFDFAVFVAGDDDVLTKRGDALSVPRDNVILEIGLFIGALGKQRVFVVSASSKVISLPSDLAGLNIGKYNEMSGLRLTSTLAPLCRRIDERIAKVGLRARELDHAMYVAAVCYKIDDDGLQFLLVRTSRGRLVFPKGKVYPGEATSVAAIRYAEDEGGVSGRPEILDTMQFRHLKEDAGTEQNVVAHIIRRTRDFPIDEKFRDPMWFSTHDAEAALKNGRTAKYSAQFRDVLKWAKRVIEASSTSKRHLAGVVPIRQDPDGKMRILLITSKNHQNWVIPKGRIHDGESFRNAALREAMEEAGISGKIGKDPLGEYEYTRLSIQHSVLVFRIEVQSELEAWEEQEARIKKWFLLEEALKLVHESALQDLVRKAIEMPLRIK